MSATWQVLTRVIILGFVWSMPLSAQNTVVLDQIEIEGVKTLTQKEVTGAVVFQPGERIQRAEIVRTVRNLETLYRNRGYEEAKVKSRTLRRGRELVLKIVVNEGHPARIADLRLVPLHASDPVFQKEWRRVVPELRGAFKLRVGGILDQATLTETRRALESVLTSDEFVGARLAEVKIRKSATPPDRKERASRWVVIEFQVDLGERVSFGFRGNERLNRSELLDIVNEQKTVGFEKNYIEKIRQRIVARYREKAYSNVRVEVLTFEKPREGRKHVSFVITEGVRAKLTSIDFDGNFVFKDNELRAAFLENAANLTQRGYYVEDEVQAAAESMVDWMKGRGFLSAKVVSIGKTLARRGKLVRLFIYLYEGERTDVRDVTIRGVQAFDQARVQELLGVQTDQPLNLFRFSEGVQELKAEYRREAYLDAQIVNEDTDTVVVYSLKNRIADVLVEVREGPQFRAGTIVISGLTKTKSFVVERELQFKTGDILRGDLLTESEKRIRKLGIFSKTNIQLRPSVGRPGYKDVRVVVEEGTPGVYGGGVGIRNDLGLRVFGRIAYTNVWHRNHTWSLSGSTNRRFEDFCRVRDGENICLIEYQFRLGYIWPWFLVPEMNFRPEIIQENRRYENFDARTSSLSLNFDRQLWGKLRGSIKYSFEVTQQRADNPIDNQTLTIGGLTPSLSYDLRDNPLSPSRGFFANASFEIADTALGSQVNPFPVGYLRGRFRADQHIPLTKGGLALYLSFRTGWEKNTVDPNSVTAGQQPFVGVPLIKQFALGGAGSLRGFKIQEINVQQSQVIQGTLSFVNYRSQLDFPLSEGLTIGPFLDAGNLFVDDFSFGNLRYGSGVGLRYRTPVGPVNFDWGFKVDPKPGEDPDRFYFTVGIL